MARTETRRRMIESAAQLFQRHGYHGVSWRGLVEAAGTPWGSISHHFPGGKEELGVAAIELGSDFLASVIETCFAQADAPDAAVRQCFRATADFVRASDFRAGCPIAVVALETAPDSAALTAASRAAFERWEGIVASKLVDAGARRGRAREVAGLVLTLLEGALLLARVHASTAPLDRAGMHAAEIVRGVLQEEGA
jgi:TetR/AcrR family transcriptional repressor of lmrAB and yxaGH operons